MYRPDFTNFTSERITRLISSVEIGGKRRRTSIITHDIGTRFTDVHTFVSCSRFEAFDDADGKIGSGRFVIIGGLLEATVSGPKNPADGFQEASLPGETRSHGNVASTY